MQREGSLAASQPAERPDVARLQVSERACHGYAHTALRMFLHSQALQWSVLSVEAAGSHKRCTRARQRRDTIHEEQEMPLPP